MGRGGGREEGESEESESGWGRARRGTRETWGVGTPVSRIKFRSSMVPERSTLVGSMRLSKLGRHKICVGPPRATTGPVSESELPGRTCRRRLPCRDTNDRRRGRREPTVTRPRRRHRTGAGARRAAGPRASRGAGAQDRSGGRRRRSRAQQESNRAAIFLPCSPHRTDLSRKAHQQDAHHVPSVRQPLVPHPEGRVLELRLRQVREDAPLWVEREGHAPSHSGHGSHALHEVASAPREERLPRGHHCVEGELGDREEFN